MLFIHQIPLCILDCNMPTKPMSISDEDYKKVKEAIDLSLIHISEPTRPY